MQYILITVENPFVYLQFAGFSETSILYLFKCLENFIYRIASHDSDTQCINVYVDDKDYLIDFAKC